MIMTSPFWMSPPTSITPPVTLPPTEYQDHEFFTGFHSLLLLQLGHFLSLAYRHHQVHLILTGQSFCMVASYVSLVPVEV